MGDGGCLSSLVALAAGLLFLYCLTYAAVVVALAAGIFMLVALIGAAVGSLKRRAEHSKPSRRSDRHG